MSAHRRPLPGLADVHAAIDHLTVETGRSPSVLALATRLGLANTTFRRNFPGICTELSGTPGTAGGTGGADAYSKVKADNARLRRDNRDLAEQLELAIAAIQRLTIDNDCLRTALQDARAVTPLPRRTR
ncbi:hypothetical protein ACGFZK_08340 [Streptomyces sp. NPDC048257]|uniref:hypothetical protein n=1 Tax=Streptomyces sp. NPDC048257 TaxID=3365526 RepID=UPI003717B617